MMVISTCRVVVVAEAEEAATWLIDVGLGNIVDNLMENNQMVTETSLANAVLEEGLTSNQFQTVRRRVETLRVTLKGRKTRTGAGQQRPDCRDIFRDPEVSRETIINESNWARLTVRIGVGGPASSYQPPGKSQWRIQWPFALCNARFARLGFTQNINREFTTQPNCLT